jgi:hypothetical protein
MIDVGMLWVARGWIAFVLLIVSSDCLRAFYWGDGFIHSFVGVVPWLVAVVCLWHLGHLAARCYLGAISLLRLYLQASSAMSLLGRDIAASIFVEQYVIIFAFCALLWVAVRPPGKSSSKVFRTTLASQ